VNVSPDNSGAVKVNGSAATSYPSVYNISRYSTVTLEAIPASGYTFSNWSGAVTGDTNPTSLYVDCDKTVTATFTPQSSGISKLYFPHVASQGGSSSDVWETEVCVINTSDQPLSGILRLHLNNGEETSPGKTITLAAHGRWSRIVGGGEFTNPSEIAYMVFESASDSAVGYTKFYQEGKYRAAIPAAKEVNTSTVTIPHIASNAEWYTGLSLVNTTSVTKELTITFDTGQNIPVTLNANEHKAFDIASLFNEQPQPDMQSAVISNANGTVGLELFGNTGGSDHLDGILLTSNTASTLYYPHVPNDDWWTGIVAYNPSRFASTITITPYDAQGIALSPEIRSLAGKKKYVGLVTELGLPAETAWFKIDSTRPLTGFMLFCTIDGNQLAAYAGGGGTGAKTGVFPKIEKDGWTGIAFVNTEADAASVTLVAYDDTGAVVATQALPPVGGHQKMVNYPEDIFSQDITSATYIAYSSNRNMVGFQLNGSSDGMMLDGLPGLDGTN
jgi:hypothetical protein